MYSFTLSYSQIQYGHHDKGLRLDIVIPVTHSKTVHCVLPRMGDHTIMYHTKGYLSHVKVEHAI